MRDVPALESRTPANHRDAGPVGRPERGAPVVVGEEHLRDVGGHERGIDLKRRQGRGVTVDPPNDMSVRLGAGHVEHRGRGIHRRDFDAAAREQA